MYWWWAAGLGAVVGVDAALLLRGGRYRRGQEQHLPSPPRSALPLAALSLAASWALLVLTAQSHSTLSAGLIFSLVGLIASWIDIDVHRIPNALNGAAALVLTGVLAVSAGILDDWQRLGQAVLAGLGLLAGFALLTVVSSFGVGDAKFAGVAGLVLGWAGWSTLILGLMAALTIAAITAVVLLIRGKSRHSHLAFGPALALGTVIALAI